MRDRNQVVLPLNLGICIPEGDFVFKAAKICWDLDYTELFNTYLCSWRKVNPITIFELIVYGYIKHLYSGREISRACKTDIRFMWLLNGEPAPSHATNSRFEDFSILFLSYSFASFRGFFIYLMHFIQRIENELSQMLSILHLRQPL